MIFDRSYFFFPVGRHAFADKARRRSRAEDTVHIIESYVCVVREKTDSNDAKKKTHTHTHTIRFRSFFLFPVLQSTIPRNTCKDHHEDKKEKRLFWVSLGSLTEKYGSEIHIYSVLTEGHFRFPYGPK